MNEAIATTLKAFKTAVAEIELHDNLDRDLGHANVLLHQVRCEIDKVWETERNKSAKGTKMPTATAMGLSLLQSLGLGTKLVRRL